MKKVKKILLILVAVCVVLGIISSLGGNDSQTQGTTTENKESTSQNLEETQTAKQVDITEQTSTSIQTETAEQTQATVTNETYVQEAESSNFTPLELYTALQDNELVPYTLNEKSTKFLSEHSILFPLADSNENKIQDSLIDYSIEARHIEKNASKYGDKLMSVSPAMVIQIHEESLTETQYLSMLNVIDSNAQQYYIFYIGELDNIFTDDIVDIIGLPIGYSQFDNTDGGQTFATVLAGCMIAPE